MTTVPSQVTQVLLAQGLISKEQASLPEEALKKMIPPEEWAKALAAAYEMEYIDPRQEPPDPDLLKSLPPVYLQQSRALPWRHRGREVVVLVSDPRDTSAVNNLRTVLRTGVMLAIASDTAIRTAISKVMERSGDTRLTMNEEPQVEAVPETPQGAAATLVRLVEEALVNGATDIHVEVVGNRAQVRFRQDGLLIKHEDMEKREVEYLIGVVKTRANLDTAERRLPQDGRFRFRSSDQTRGAEIRVSTLPTVNGEEVVMRILPKEGETPQLENLGFGEAILEKLRSVAGLPHGLFLVTGPTGSGKTTTLFALIREILESRNPKILSVEDPVEYRLVGVSQVQVNETAGLTFARALRAFLRQDPDVILVGEIRDGETAHIAVEAAMTGHLVLGTLHTNDAPSAVNRLVEMGVAPYLLVDSIRGVLAQRLVPRLCDRCKMPDPESQTFLVTTAKLPEAETKAHRRGEGCPLCRSTGFRGRVALHELFWVTPSIRQALADRRPGMRLHELAARESGYRPLILDGYRKVAQGLCDLRSVIEATRVN